jgi:GTP cyclohydrolase IA
MHYNAETLKQAATKIEEAMRIVGLTPDASDMRDTPTRVAKLWADMAQNHNNPFPKVTTEAIYDSNEELKITLFEGKLDELIVETQIHYSSFCSHHLLPFFGAANIGYLPSDKILGASKIPRIVDFYANRPQSQEALTSNIADYIERVTGARFVGVMLVGEHTCCGCRGVRKHGMKMVTSCFRPSNNPSLKAEFLSIVGSCK